MHLPDDMEFCALGVGAIIERELNGVHSVLIQNRIRVDDATQNHLIEVPCGKVFFICKAEIGNMKSCSDAATDIRWVSVENLKQMLDTKQELFFPFVYGALKKYTEHII